VQLIGAQRTRSKFHSLPIEVYLFALQNHHSALLHLHRGLNEVHCQTGHIWLKTTTVGPFCENETFRKSQFYGAVLDRRDRELQNPHCTLCLALLNDTPFSVHMSKTQ
jgi:hypothetical protein